MTAIDEDQKKQVRIYLGYHLRVFYAPRNHGSVEANPLGDHTPLGDLVCSLATRRNIQGMAQLLLAFATDYLLTYDDFSFIETVFDALLKAYWVLEEIIAQNIDPSNRYAVVVAMINERTYLYCFIVRNDHSSRLIFCFCAQQIRKTTTACTTRSTQLPSICQQTSPAIASRT